MKQELEFTIIIPVCHGRNFLDTALGSLLRIDFPADRFEAIVAGAFDDEESKQIVRCQSDRAAFSIIYIDCSGKKRAEKLNAACHAARGRVLAFADDDCIFLENWLKKLLEVLQSERTIGIIGGREEPAQSGSTFDIALDTVLNSFVATGGIRKGSGARVGEYYPKLWNMAVPHDVATDISLKTIKGVPEVFDEALTIHEDVELANRIKRSGKRIVFAPDWCIRHYRDTTFLSFFVNNVSMGRTCRSMGIHRLPHALLTSFAVGMPVFFSFSLFFDFLRTPFFIVSGVYGIVILAAAVAGFFGTKRVMASVMMPVLFVSLHVARGLGFLFPLRTRREVPS